VNITAQAVALLPVVFPAGGVFAELFIANDGEKYTRLDQDEV
jgi:hypothetical protein